MAVTFDFGSVVGVERVNDIRKDANDQCHPSDLHNKVITAAYHPGDVVQTALKYLGNELGFGQQKLTEPERDLLISYYDRFNSDRMKKLTFADWVRYILASEMAARAFHVEEQ